MQKIFLKYYLILLVPISSIAQKIDNTASFREIKNDNYCRILYENDYFAASDFYYTQGYNFELISPKLKRNFLNHLLYKLKNSQEKYGLAIEQIGFTPTNISSGIILYGDRPFAAAVLLKSFLISIDTLHKTRIASTICIGAIGPNAYGGEIQKSIHKWIGDEIPNGWQYQIQNDILLNYELSFEKNFYELNHLLAINSNTKLRLGTTYTNISGGFTTIFGRNNSSFGSLKDKDCLRIYGYYQFLVSVIGYDASLEGGLFNKNSCYIISNNAINRIVLQNNMGIVLQFKKIYLEFSHTEISKEFKTGNTHAWGGIGIGLK